MRTSNKLLLGLALLGSHFSALAADTFCTEEAMTALRKHTLRLVVVNTNGSSVQQTAFRVAGRAGLFTSLHGLIDATSIAASRFDSEKEVETYSGLAGNGLRIAAIDKLADLAFLVPEDGIFPKPGSGIETGDGLTYGGTPDDGVAGTVPPTNGLCTMGYPLGLPRLVEDSLPIRDRVKRLTNLLGDDKNVAPFEAYLRSTDSPNLNRAVFSLAGTIRKGNSGAPLVDGQGRVIAVANGGLGIDLNWAIPLAPSCFFPQKTCTSERLSSEERTRILKARKTISMGTSGHRLFSSTVLHLPQPTGSITHGPSQDLFLGPYRHFEATAEFTSCNKVTVSLKMVNDDPVMGFCFRPRVEVFGEDPAELLFKDPEYGRLCLGSVLGDEAVLRLWEIVGGRSVDDPRRRMLGLGDKRYAELEQSRIDICERREQELDSCKPYRAGSSDVAVPPYSTTRHEPARVLEPVNGKSGCIDGKSVVYGIRWIYNPARKPDGVFEALDVVERALIQAANVADAVPTISAVAAEIGKCSRSSMEACLPDVARSLVLDPKTNECLLKSDTGDAICHAINQL